MPGLSPRVTTFSNASSREGSPSTGITMTSVQLPMDVLEPRRAGSSPTTRERLSQQTQRTFGAKFGHRPTLARHMKQVSQLRKLERSWLFSMLAVYHSYFLFTAIAIGLILGSNLLLDWFIGWFQMARRKYQSDQNFHSIPIRTYLGCLIRCNLLIRAMTEALRSAIWLLADAWKMQAFQLYRTALTGSAFNLMRKGESTSVAERLATSGAWYYENERQWKKDFAAQIFIYFCFDVMPLLLAAYDAYRSWESWVWFLGQLQMHMCSMACFQVAFFHMCWTVNDVAAKVASFRDSRPKATVEDDDLVDRSSHKSDGIDSDSASSEGEKVELPEDVEECMPSIHGITATGSEFSVDSLNEKRNGLGSSLRWIELRDLNLDTESVHRSFQVQPRRPANRCMRIKLITIADIRKWVSKHADPQQKANSAAREPTSLCMFLLELIQTWWCRSLRTVIFLIVLISVAATSGELPNLKFIGVLVCGIPFAGCRTRFLCSPLSRRLEMFCLSRRCLVPNTWEDSLRCAWRWAIFMQRWSEKQCSVSLKALGPRFEMWSIWLCLQCVAFKLLDWTEGTWTFALLAIFVICRRLTLRAVRPWGWLLCFVEALFMCGFGVFFKPKRSWWFVAICIANQFTLARHETYMFQTYQTVGTALQVCFLIVICMSLSALSHDAEMWRAQKARGPAQARALTEKQFNRYPFCDMIFPLNEDPRSEDLKFNFVNTARYLTVLDFAEMCNITRLPDAEMNQTLDKILYGWRVAYKHRANGKEKTDWSTFFEFVDPWRSTSVFAIRGTQGALDLLQDINMFLPVAISQLAGAVGPQLTDSILESIWYFSRSASSRTQTWINLVHHVKSRMQEDPHRRYYLTGHSLGGGIAKLVALELDVVAVTFSSPGVQHTASWLLSHRTPNLNKTSRMQKAPQYIYNVVPVNDFIPTVDAHVGSQLRIACTAGWFMCHNLDITLEELRSGCSLAPLI